MVEIGGQPILWHILKAYSHYGINDFVICLGYKGYVIKEYFANYLLHSADVTIDIKANCIQMHKNHCEAWRVTLVDTGACAMTGGRLKRILSYVQDDEMFCFTYGDGLSDVNIRSLIKFHRRHGKAVTLTATQPTGKFGAVEIFILSPRVADYIEGDDTIWEREPLERLSREGEVFAFKHRGFWQPMDTLHDKHLLEVLWSTGKAPWKVW
jgi:glucose-1-phosphate cytidylyltransferase